MATGHENLDEMSKDEILLQSNRPSTSKVDSEVKHFKCFVIAARQHGHF